jgi:hypothetical protein
LLLEKNVHHVLDAMPTRSTGAFLTPAVIKKDDKRGKQSKA